MNHPPAPVTPAPSTRPLATVPAGGYVYANGEPVEQHVIDEWRKSPIGPYPGYGDPRDD